MRSNLFSISKVLFKVKILPSSVKIDKNSYEGLIDDALTLRTSCNGLLADNSRVSVLMVDIYPFFEINKILS